MKKTISIKSVKLLVENLVENSLKVGDVDYEKKLRRRVTDLHRAREMAKAAFDTAEANGQDALAAQLQSKVEELNDLLANYNTDSLDTEEEGGGGGDTSGSGGGGDTQNQKNSKNPEKDDSDEGDEGSEKKGSENKSDNGDADDGEDDSNKDSSKDSNDTGDGDEDSDVDGDDESDDEDSSDEGGNGKSKDKDGDEDSEGGNGDPEESEDDDPGAIGGKGDPGEDDDSDGSDEGGNGDPGDDSNEPGDDGNGDPETKSKSKGEDTSDDSDGDGDPENDDEDSGSSKGSKSKKSDSGESEGGGSSDEDASDEENDSEEDSEEQSDGKNSQSKTKPSLDPNSSNSNSNAQPEFKNPFADEEDIPGGLGGMNMGGEPPRDATVDETIELLKTLKGEGRQGAIDALKDLIAKRKSGVAAESFKPTITTSLTEAVKGVRDMTDDEFGDYINGVYDLIDQVTPIDYVDDFEERKGKVGKWSNDPDAIQELQQEADLDLQKDYQKKKARDAAKAKYSRKGTLKEFEMDFYAAINNQIEIVRQEYQSYDEINTEYESEDAIMKADIVKELPAEAIPIVDIYFDVSGSWEDTDIAIGEAAVASVKAFEDQGELVMNIFYFSNGVDNNSMERCRAIYGWGTGGWPKILQNIKATGAKNVLIMTDHDIEDLNGTGYGAADCGSLKVEGCVWYLWKNGESSPTCVKKLTGAQGTYQYAFQA